MTFFQNVVLIQVIINLKFVKIVYFQKILTLQEQQKIFQFLIGKIVKISH